MSLRSSSALSRSLRVRVGSARTCVEAVGSGLTCIPITKGSAPLRITYASLICARPARIDIDYHGLTTHIATLNRKHAPERMDLEFVEGPFDRFKGHWRFVALGEAGCRVEFSVDYAFSSGAMDKLLAPVFGHIIETLVDRFVTRADALAERRAGA